MIRNELTIGKENFAYWIDFYFESDYTLKIIGLLKTEKSSAGLVSSVSSSEVDLL